MAKKRKRRIWVYVLAVIAAAIIGFIFYYNIVTHIEPPTELDPKAMGFERRETGPGQYVHDQGWLRKNKYGLWEMYIEGSPLELGILHGLLVLSRVPKHKKTYRNYFISFEQADSPLSLL